MRRFGWLVLVFACSPGERAATPGPVAAKTAALGAPAPAPAPSAAASTGGEAPTAGEEPAGATQDASPQPAADPLPTTELEPPPRRKKQWLRALIRGLDRRRYAELRKDPARFRHQVIVTEIVMHGGTPWPTEYRYRPDEEYFFSASSIKTFASVGALHHLEELQAEGIPVDLSTPLALCEEDESPPCQTTKDDSNVEGGVITLGHEIRKMHLVSNNRSYNRLLNFAGHRRIHDFFWDRGFRSLKLQTRMAGDGKRARHVRAVELRLPAGKRHVIEGYDSKLRFRPLDMPSALVGRAKWRGKARPLLEEPADYTRKNYVSLKDMHRMYVALVRPDLQGVPQLDLKDAHRQFLMNAMRENPGESTNPLFPGRKGTGNRYKLMSAGLERVLPLDRLRYLNKPGKAYGFHLENAYVEDMETGRAFFVTAVLYVNANEIIHDDVYEYASISRPFFRDLGEALAREILLDPPPEGPAASG